jgi:acyl-CoA synthetase (NDP forming)
MGLSRLAIEHPKVAEIDVNPLIASPEGSVSAVDALVVLGAAAERRVATPTIEPAAIRALFYPRSVAFVGASQEMGKWGYFTVTNTISGGFEGEIYLVNPKGGEILGRPVYRSVCDIPDSIDLGVVTIPAAKVLDLIPQFRQKGIRNMLLISSGFAETGEAGRDLEQQLVEEGRRADITILGPNTMGICNPHINFYCMGSHVRPAPGSTAVVAQSGNMGMQLLAFAEQQGIGIRGFCGSGNEAMITVEDFLDGLEIDDETNIVMLYIESVKNGRRFFDSARRVGRNKPIVLLKGGQSGAGNRAAASHTGAMASDSTVFDAACRQTGIVKVEQSMDLLDLSAAFSSLPLPKGNRAAIMTLGGGWGVVTADLCARYGIEVPDLSPAIIERFDEFLPPYWSRSNPVDLVGERDPSLPFRAVEELVKWDGCDVVINLGILGRRLGFRSVLRSSVAADPNFDEDALEKLVALMEENEREYVGHVVRLMERHHKPILGVSLLTDETDKTVYAVDGCTYRGVFYPTPERAVKALARMNEYDRFLQRG